MLCLIIEKVITSFYNFVDSFQFLMVMFVCRRGRRDQGDKVTSTLYTLRALWFVICDLWKNKSTTTQNKRAAKNHGENKILPSVGFS